MNRKADMIVVNETRREDAAQLKTITSSNEPLPERTRRAVEAAAAVERGEVDLEQATRRFGTAAALIEVWQHALKAVRRNRPGPTPPNHDR